MDLTRWGARGIRRISDKTKDLYELVGDLLDGQFTPLMEESSDHSAKAFTASSDVESVIAKFLHSRESDKPGVSEVFSALTPFYGAGFHLHRETANSWCLRDLFLCGRKFTPGKSPQLPFVPPHVEPHAVVRGCGQAVMRAFELERLSQFNESQAFLFGIERKSLFLLLCDLPAPWLEDHIVRTRAVLDAVLELSPTHATNNAPLR